MKRMLNRMSDTSVYRYSTGFTIAVLSAEKATEIVSGYFDENMRG